VRSVKSYNIVSNAVSQPWDRPTIVLPLVDCPDDNTLFEISPEFSVQMCQVNFLSRTVAANVVKYQRARMIIASELNHKSVEKASVCCSGCDWCYRHLLSVAVDTSGASHSGAAMQLWHLRFCMKHALTPWQLSGPQRLSYRLCGLLIITYVCRHFHWYDSTEIVHFIFIVLIGSHLSLLIRLVIGLSLIVRFYRANARCVCIARITPSQDVRRSVRLSVTRRYCVETAKRIAIFSPQVATLFKFFHIKRYGNITTGSP